MLLLLLRLRELLVEEDRWTQYAEARNNDGYPVRHYSKFACSWCLTGAVARIANEHPEVKNGYHRLLSALNREVKITCHVADIQEWNDVEDRQHSEVIALLDRAIKRVRRKK